MPLGNLDGWMSTASALLRPTVSELHSEPGAMIRISRENFSKKLWDIKLEPLWNGRIAGLTAFNAVAR